MNPRFHYRALWINALIALAVTLLVNFSFLGVGEMAARRSPAFPVEFVLLQVFYFYGVTWVMLSLNTVRQLNLWQKVVLSLGVICVLYLLIPSYNRGTMQWGIQLFHPRLFNPFQVMRVSLVLVVGLLYGKIYELVYQKQNIAIENQQLKTENLQTRYNMLANQISPHFLFNSLNSLSMLVREGSRDRALQYIDVMADTFRYLLHSGQTEITTLREEIAFSEAYLYLHTIRYENKLFFDLQIEPRLLEWKLPIMSLQPLIENAVKHNSITLSRPLCITIRTQGDRLVVSNPIIAKIEPTAGTGIGLQNLTQRYALLAAGQVQVHRRDECFEVSLPLIQ